MTNEDLRQPCVPGRLDNSQQAQLAAANASLRSECDALREVLIWLREHGGCPHCEYECPVCHAGPNEACKPDCRLAAALAKHSGGTR